MEALSGHQIFRLPLIDIFTDGLMLLARSINPSAPSFFRAKLSPYARSNKNKVVGSRSYSALVPCGLVVDI